MSKTVTVKVSVPSAEGQPMFEFTLEEGTWLSESKLDETVFALYGLQPDGRPHVLEVEFPEGFEPKRIS